MDSKHTSVGKASTLTPEMWENRPQDDKAGGKTPSGRDVKAIDSGRDSPDAVHVHNKAGRDSPDQVVVHQSAMREGRPIGERQVETKQAAAPRRSAFEEGFEQVLTFAGRPNIMNSVLTDRLDRVLASCLIADPDSARLMPEQDLRHLLRLLVDKARTIAQDRPGDQTFDALLTTLYTKLGGRKMRDADRDTLLQEVGALQERLPGEQALAPEELLGIRMRMLVHLRAAFGGAQMPPRHIAPYMNALLDAGPVEVTGRSCVHEERLCHALRELAGPAAPAGNWQLVAPILQNAGYRAPPSSLSLVAMAMARHMTESGKENDVPVMLAQLLDSARRAPDSELRMACACTGVVLLAREKGVDHPLTSTLDAMSRVWADCSTRQQRLMAAAVAACGPHLRQITDWQNERKGESAAVTGIVSAIAKAREALASNAPRSPRQATLLSVQAALAQARPPANREGAVRTAPAMVDNPRRDLSEQVFRLVKQLMKNAEDQSTTVIQMEDFLRSGLKHTLGLALPLGAGDFEAVFTRLLTEFSSIADGRFGQDGFRALVSTLVNSARDDNATLGPIIQRGLEQTGERRGPRERAKIWGLVEQALIERAAAPGPERKAQEGKADAT